MTGPSKIRLRNFRMTDRIDVLALFEQVFGFKRAAEEWDWRFMRNPPTLSGTVPEVFAMLAVDDADAGRIVGQFAVTPTYMNHAGEKVLGCQAGDGMVHPSYQGLGLFARTVEQSHRDLEQQGFKLVFGFPNKNSLPGFMRNLLWEPVFRLREYELQLRIRGVPTPYHFAPTRLLTSLRNKIRNKRLSLSSAEVGAIPNDHDSLWKRVAPYEILSLWKDSAYLSWRYQSYPGRTYRFFELRSGQQLLGLCVVSVREGEFSIMEMIVQQKVVSLGRSLVDCVVKCAISEKAVAVRFSGNDDGYWAAIFDGFSAGLLELQFCARVFSGGRLANRSVLPHNWSVTNGDLDVG